MVKNIKTTTPVPIGKLHKFSESEVIEFREKLLAWYDDNQRVLPWRTIAATETDCNKRTYAVWVSEMMLQQTQVATVMEYFKKWINNWPTVSSLAQASLEEVNQMWAGLGYYSRARRLHEGAIKVVNELNGEFPRDRDSLVEKLPGVGRYSGSAIASIALGECVGVVDGNVNRVMARIRGIGADITSQSTVDHMWSLADQVVDHQQPGNFNQALMELGATVCTPKTPSCSSCPLQSMCIAYQKSQDNKSENSISSHFKAANGSKDKATPNTILDIECVPGCVLCLPDDDWDKSLGVLNYPRKAPKAQPREETTAVVIVQQKSGEMLLVQRPKTGLLANLWEFPSITLLQGQEADWEKYISKELAEEFELPMSSRTYVSDVMHIFSHIKQTYKVYKLVLDIQEVGMTFPERYQAFKFMTKEEFLSSATSTAMKKVFKAMDSSKDKKPNGQKNKRGEKENTNDVKKQKTLSHFFTAVPKRK